MKFYEFLMFWARNSRISRIPRNSRIPKKKRHPLTPRKSKIPRIKSRIPRDII